MVANSHENKSTMGTRRLVGLLLRAIVKLEEGNHFAKAKASLIEAAKTAT